MLFNNTLLFCPPRYPYGDYIAGTITPYKKVSIRGLYSGHYYTLQEGVFTAYPWQN